MAKKTYTLRQLADRDNIDAYVEALSAMDDIIPLRMEAYAMEDVEYPEDEDDLLCPGELAQAWETIAGRDKFRFDAKGRIVSYELYHK